MSDRPESESIDWSRTTWEGSRRDQLDRWASLSFDEILDAQEEMAELTADLARQAHAEAARRADAIHACDRRT